MITKNLIKFGFVTFLILIIAYLAYLAISGENEEMVPQPWVTPIPTFAASPTIFRTNLPDKTTASGISMDNFYRTAQQILPNGDVIISYTSDFHLVYFGQGDYFLLSIDASPFFESRQKSEQALLKLLNLTETEACKLKIRVITPRWVNPDYTDNDYPLSFCE